MRSRHFCEETFGPNVPQVEIFSICARRKFKKIRNNTYALNFDAFGTPYKAAFDLDTSLVLCTDKTTDFKL